MRFFFFDISEFEWIEMILHNLNQNIQTNTITVSSNIKLRNSIELNHQRDESESLIWLKSSFLPVEKIIFLQMKYQFQWNDNLFIIEFFLSISILNESFELKVHIKLNRKILIQRLQEIYLSLFQQLTFRIDESSIQLLVEIQWMI